MHLLSFPSRPCAELLLTLLILCGFPDRPSVKSFVLIPSCRGPKLVRPVALRSTKSKTLFAVEAPEPITTTASSRRNDVEKIVLPGAAFRDTKLGELSVASCNLLAPFYHSLSHPNASARLEFAQEDRLTRFPLALEMAKKTNADILLLQEMEGGPLFEPTLVSLLKEPPSNDIAGYDAYLWTPLLPNKPDHPIGLCVAWRSHKHEMIAHEGYKRGMVCQFRERIPDKGEDPTSTVGTFALANVHLPARPNQILGRLIYMSKSVQTLTAMDVPTRESPLDGLLLVGGDWNCDHTSVAARLLTHGWVSPGNVRDRNYKANISKVLAARMGHGYRFKDIYSTPQLRQQYAPVTVSLRGRGPGCMDHLFYTQAPPRSQSDSSRTSIGATKVTLPGMENKSSTTSTKLVMSKRKVRREKAIRLRRISRGGNGNGGSGAFRPHVLVESVMATIAGLEDTERLELINDGLPNVEHGYPSDHIPIGALFVPSPEFDENWESVLTQDAEDRSIRLSTAEDSSEHLSFSSPGGVSTSVQRRREAGRQSMSVRRRHNLVLRTIAEWLEVSRKKSPIQDISLIRDQPLYKNPWTTDLVGLTKKSRAPDLVCIIGNVFVVVEISVVTATKVESVIQQKFEKYKDLPALLKSSPMIEEKGLIIADDPLIIVMDEETNELPAATVHAVDTLASYLYPGDAVSARIEGTRCCHVLQNLF